MKYILPDEREQSIRFQELVEVYTIYIDMTVQNIKGFSIYLDNRLHLSKFKFPRFSLPTSTVSNNHLIQIFCSRQQRLPSSLISDTANNSPLHPQRIRKVWFKIGAVLKYIQCLIDVNPVYRSCGEQGLVVVGGERILTWQILFDPC